MLEKISNTSKQKQSKFELMRENIAIIRKKNSLLKKKLRNKAKK